MANWADQILGTALQQRRRAEDAQAPPAIPQEAPPASIWDAVKRRFSDAVDSDAAQNTKTAVIKGGSATVGLLGDVPRIAEAVSGEKNLSPKWNDDLAVMMALSGAPLVGAFPSSEDIQRWVFSKTPEYQPKTKGEKLFQNVVAGATSGLLPGAGVLGPITGAAGAAGSTVAEELFPDSKWAPLLGGLAAGGGALGAYNLVRPSNSKVAKSLLAGIDESELDNAAALTRSSVAQGMGPLTPGEALRNAPMLQMQSMVEASAEGAPLRRVMAERGPATFKAIEGQLNGMLPGSSPTQGMTAVQGAGKKHIGNLRDKAEEAAGPLYEKSFADARPIGIDTRPILGKIRQIGDDNPSVRGTLDGLVKSVMTDRTGNPITDLEQLQNGIKKGLGDLAGEAARAGKNSLARDLMEAQETLLKTLDQQSPGYKTARQVYAEKMIPVNEAEAGLIGRILDSKDLSKAASVFLDPKNETPDDIIKAATALNSVSDQAVPALVQKYLANKLEDAANASRKDVSRVGSNFADRAIGPEGLSTKSAQNIEAAIKQLPEGDVRWKAWQRMTDVLRAQGARLQPGSPTQQRLLLQEKMSNYGGAVGKAAQFVSTKGGSITDWLKERRYSGNMDALAKVFADPNSIDALRALARETDLRKANALVTSLLGTEPALSN